MGGREGGTSYHCPSCDEIRTCAAITQERDGQNFVTKFGEVRYFYRTRKCLSCGHTFDTAEILLGQLNEFMDRYDIFLKGGDPADEILADCSASLSRIQDEAKSLARRAEKAATKVKAEMASHRLIKVRKG